MTGNVGYSVSVGAFVGTIAQGERLYLKGSRLQSSVVEMAEIPDKNP